jgi:hypothetical protein
MASGKPILAAVPMGDVRDFLIAAGNASLCEPPDVDAMKRIIREHIRRKLQSAPPPPQNRAAIARFERRRLTEDLARVFDRVLGAAEPAPRSNTA